MSRIHVCVACNNERHGVKTRIAVPHTCGGNGMLGDKDFLKWLDKTNLMGSTVPLHIRYKMYQNQKKSQRGQNKIL